MVLEFAHSQCNYYLHWSYRVLILLVSPAEEKRFESISMRQGFCPGITPCQSPPLPGLYIRNKNWNKNNTGIKIKPYFSRNASNVRHMRESRYSVIVNEVIGVGNLAKFTYNHHLFRPYLI